MAWFVPLVAGALGLGAALISAESQRKAISEAKEAQEREFELQKQLAEEQERIRLQTELAILEKRKQEEEEKILAIEKTLQEFKTLLGEKKEEEAEEISKLYEVKESLPQLRELVIPYIEPEQEVDFNYSKIILFAIAAIAVTFVWRK